MSRVARVVASVGWAAPACTTANSSPPTRATVSRIADAVSQAAGDGFQQHVANGMTERVVHALEVVDIETKHCELLVARVLQGIVETIVEEHPVGQIRQGVMPRQVRNLGLGLKPLGNVFMGRDPAAAWDRMIDDDDGAAIGHTGSAARTIFPA